MSRPLKANHSRIIGGRWRGRVWQFPDVAGMRPTPNRVRETLFNWLQLEIQQARCLDCFAGSGALSLEALSRGAATATIIEKAPLAHAALQRTLREFTATNVTLLLGDAMRILPTLAGPYDIIFVDPPFEQGWLAMLLPLIKQFDLLATDGKLYVETESKLTLLEFANDWKIYREKVAGQVRYALLQHPHSGLS